MDFFPKPVAILFVKEVLFSLATTVGTPLQLDLATLKKKKSNCARMKVQLDLAFHFSKNVCMIRVDETTKENTVHARVHYDALP